MGPKTLAKTDKNCIDSKIYNDLLLIHNKELCMVYFEI